jgi:polyisoprenoid-binding protein YceI
MKASDDRPMSRRLCSPATRCLVMCAGMMATGPSVGWAQSQASDSAVHKDSAVQQDSAVHRDSVVYQVVPESRFEVKTSKAGVFGFAGHDHVVRARAFNGFVIYYPADPATSRLELTVPAESLEVLTPPDTAEIRQVTEAMRTKVLHVADYPEIRFTATGGPTTEKGMRLQGEMTLVGHTRPVQVDAVIDVGADTIRATGTFSVKQTDFGIKPYSGGPAGTVKVGNRVTFSFDAIAVRSLTSASDRASARDRRND